MAFDRVVIGVDTVAQLVAAVNTNAGLSVFDASIDSSGVVSFLDDAAAVLFTLDTPGFPNQVTDGLVISTSGVSPNFAVDYTAGTYFFENASYDITPAGSVALTAPDVTFPRVDAVFVDADGIVKVSDGTPAANPVAPAVAGLLLAQILVPLLGGGSPSVASGGSGELPTTATLGDVLVWNGSAWVGTSAIRAGTDEGVLSFQNNAKTITTPFYTTTDETLNGAYTFVIAGVGVANLTMTNAADLSNGQEYTIKNLSGGNVNIISDTTFDGVASPYILGNGISVRFIYSLDLNDWTIN